MGGKIALLLATCTVISQGLNINLLSQNVFESSSRLHYWGGDCTWKVSGLFGRQDVILNGPHIDLEALDTSVGIICEVNGTALLQAVIINQAAFPPPHNVTLDTVNKRLQWDHPFLPQLPPLFELVYGFIVTYQVHGTGSGVPPLSVAATNNYLNFTSESIKHCAEYKFVVQAVSNVSDVPPSQNSSVVRGNFSRGAPSFRNLSAIVLPIKHQEQLHVHIFVTFELEDEDCPGTHPTFFIVILEGKEHKFNINSTHVDNGKTIVKVPLTEPVMNACHLEGTLFGGNNAGNCTECTIQHPENSHCSSTTPAGTTSTAVAIFSPVPPFSEHPESSGGSNKVFVIGVIAGSIFVVIIMSLVVGMLLIFFYRKRDSIKPHETEQNYYSTASARTSVRLSPAANPQSSVTYTEVDLTSNKPSPPFNNSPTGYALVDHKKTQEMAQEWKPISDGQLSSAIYQCASAVPTPEESLTISQCQQERSGLSLADLDGLLAVLKTLSPKWYELGTQLKLSETLLDETQTNIDTDLQCLIEILTNWLSYHEPSLEKINGALVQMNEPTLLYDTNNREFGVLNETPPELPPR